MTRTAPLPYLRLRCPCSRNLADVTRPQYSDGSPANPDWTEDGLMVTPRPNVRQKDWRAWHEANATRPVNQPPPGRLAQIIAQAKDEPWPEEGEPFRPYERPDWDDGRRVPKRPELFDTEGNRIGDAADWHARTNTWHCRCGLTHSRRHERISAAWQEWIIGDTLSVVVVLGSAL